MFYLGLFHTVGNFLTSFTYNQVLSLPPSFWTLKAASIYLSMFFSPGSNSDSYCPVKKGIIHTDGYRD